MKKCDICAKEMCEPLQCFECRKWVCNDHKGICKIHNQRLCLNDYNNHMRRVKH